MTQIEAIENLDNVINNIERSRLQVSDHHIVQLVAISKYSNKEDIRTLYNSGQRAFGENKVQDLKVKMEALDDLPIAWHFVGTLQKNKINNLIDLSPVLMHSLDSLDLAQELDKKLKAKNKTMNCLLQINSAYEDTKSGVDPKDALNIYKEIKEQYTNINLKGIMSIGAHSEDKDLIEKSFKNTKEIFNQTDGTICSMGMSSDYENAILSGSNMVRIGSKLFKNK
ncbi:MAG: YggS family pyridoxal phosphate-dependent enzyme [Campylobacterota bacterium]|nr:YggS family pyridoxal phosphate-dependent enzyme [Campylobacterota bacterium]